MTAARRKIVAEIAADAAQFIQSSDRVENMLQCFAANHDVECVVLERELFDIAFAGKISISADFLDAGS